MLSKKNPADLLEATKPVDSVFSKNYVLSSIVVLTKKWEARCSSVVRAFTHCAMDRRIDPSWGGSISRSSQCSTTGLTKAVVCIILFVG